MTAAAPSWHNDEAGRPLARRRMRVAMRDVDRAGVIYFPAPLSWHEALYTSWLVAIGHPLSVLLADGQATATVSVTADYLAPVTLDDEVCLELRSGAVGRSSFVLETHVHPVLTGELAVRVRTTHVWAATDSQGAATRLSTSPAPDWLRTALASDAVHDVT